MNTARPKPLQNTNPNAKQATNPAIKQTTSPTPTKFSNVAPSKGVQSNPAPVKPTTAPTKNAPTPTRTGPPPGNHRVACLRLSVCFNKFVSNVQKINYFSERRCRYSTKGKSGT